MTNNNSINSNSTQRSGHPNQSPTHSNPNPQNHPHTPHTDGTRGHHDNGDVSNISNDVNEDDEITDGNDNPNNTSTDQHPDDPASIMAMIRALTTNAQATSVMVQTTNASVESLATSVRTMQTELNTSIDDSYAVICDVRPLSTPRYPPFRDLYLPSNKMLGR